MYSSLAESRPWAWVAEPCSLWEAGRGLGLVGLQEGRRWPHCFLSSPRKMRLQGA